MHQPFLPLLFISNTYFVFANVEVDFRNFLIGIVPILQRGAKPEHLAIPRSNMVNDP